MCRVEEAAATTSMAAMGATNTNNIVLTLQWRCLSTKEAESISPLYFQCFYVSHILDFGVFRKDLDPRGTFGLARLTLSRYAKVPHWDGHYGHAMRGADVILFFYSLVPEQKLDNDSMVLRASRSIGTRKYQRKYESLIFRQSSLSSGLLEYMIMV